MTVLVLASASAARARLLTAAGVAAERDPAGVDEARVKAESRRRGHSAVECAQRLAEAKARAVAARHSTRLVLGADQILDCDGRWFDKPADRADARAQLGALNGRTHELVTAATIVRDGEVLWCALERPRLTMRHCGEGFLEGYLAAMGDRVLSTVGGYELEGYGVQLMARIEGDCFSVLGLPLLGVLEFLRATGALAS
ncbi:MAG TPA: Maf family nucleotide pyrophosphatase [Stellaceae bacterium]|nr:Maf family nucleotide pyrophosphatase [Stellaceae bacterium]